jgi:cytochrome P450/nitrite reductase/ring-hydroxylating ferredoxin subunit
MRRIGKDRNLMHDTQITTTGKLEQQTLLGAQVDGVELIAVACKGKINVFEGRCPHEGTLLSEGHVENGRLVCRGHGWEFECSSGAKFDDTQTCLHRFSVELRGDRVLIDRAEVAAWAAERAQEDETDRDQPLLSPNQLPGPRGLPILGNLLQINPERFHLILEEWYRQYGDIYEIRLGPDRAVVISDPQIVRKILQARPDDFARLHGIRQTIEEMGIQGLFSAEGEQWRRHRQLATRTFDVRHLRDFFPLLVKVTRRLQTRWHKLAAQDSPIDVQKELMRYTVDVTTNLAFGYDMNTLEEEGDRIQRHLERIFPMIAYRAFMPVRHWNYLKLPADRALEASLAEVRVSINHFVENAREEMAADQALWERPRNLLQSLLAAHADEDVALSDDEILGNVFTFLLAGEDTTANSIAWMMYFMAKYPEVQGKMQTEADAVVGGEAALTAYEQTSELNYIEAVAHETMRFKPVATFLALQALREVTVGRLHMTEGTPVFLLLRPKGMEDSEFAEATQFTPERWLDYSRSDNPHHRNSYLPFGGGPRLCPGRSLALLEIKMAVSMICRHFHVVRAEPDREIEEKFAFTMMPQDLLVSLHRRSG